jgi:hypothetical protein
MPDTAPAAPGNFWEAEIADMNKPAGTGAVPLETSDSEGGS